MRILIITFSMIMFSGSVVLTDSCLAADWPQWFGPNRDGVSSEKGDSQRLA